MRDPRWQKHRAFKQFPSEEEKVEHDVEDALLFSVKERLDSAIQLLASANNLEKVAGAENDWAELLEIFNKNSVQYVVIGGLAVLRLVPYRTTRDLDLFVQPTLDNMQRVHRSIQEFLGVNPGMTPEEMLSTVIFQYGAARPVEMHTSVPGVTWAEVWNSKEPADFLGVPSSFSDLDSLISMKEAVPGQSKWTKQDLDRLYTLRRRKDE